MRQLKKVLREAFSDKQLQQALMPFRRKIQSKLTGDLANYVSALENVLQQTGKSSTMDDRTMRREILKNASGEAGESPLFEPGTTTRPAQDPGKAEPGKEEPESDWPQGLFPGKDKPGEKPGKEEPGPEGEKEMPPLSKVSHDPGKKPVTSRDIPKWKKNVYTQKDQPSFADEEPKDEPYSVSRAKSYLAGEDEPLGSDPDYLKKVKKGLEKSKKPGAMPSSEPEPPPKPKSGDLKFDPTSSYLDPAVTRKMNKQGVLPSLKKVFKRGK